MELYIWRIYMGYSFPLVEASTFCIGLNERRINIHVMHPVVCYRQRIIRLY